MEFKHVGRAVVSTGVSALFTFFISSAAYAETLQGAVKKTIDKNPEIQVELTEKRSREEDVRQARAGYFPTLDATAGDGVEWSNNPTTRADDHCNGHVNGCDWVRRSRFEAGLEFRQMLFDGFLTPNEVRRHKSRVNDQAFRVFSIAENRALGTAEAYLNVMRRQRLLELAEENYKAHQRVYDQVELRSQSGVGRKSDLDQVEGRRALANSNVIAEKSNLIDAETNYLRVVGEVPQDGLEQPEPPAGKMPETMDEAVQKAVDNHPTLKQAGYDVDEAKAQYEVSKHAFYPRFDFEAGRTWNAELDGTDGRNDDVTVMVRMRYNLFAGGKDKARKQQTAHLVDQAKERRNDVYRQVVESMRLSWNAYTATRDNLKYLEDHMKASEKTQEAYAKQFNLGKRTLLDLLDTENELFEARRAYTAALYDNIYAQYRVLTGMGVLLDHLGIEKPAEIQTVDNSDPW